MGNPILSRIAEPVKDPMAPEIARLVEDMKVWPVLQDMVDAWSGCGS